jgi:uncharacterized protein YceK
MKKIIVSAIAVIALSGCTALQQQALQSDEGTPQPTTTTVERQAIYLYPDNDPTSMCNGLYGVDMPCNRVLDVCVDTPEGTSSKWIPEFVRCTDAHPRSADVCRLAPPEEWAFYGYTPEECSAVTP